MYASTKLPKDPDHRLGAMNGLLLKEGKGPLRLLYRLVSHVHLLTYRKARCSQQLRKADWRKGMLGDFAGSATARSSLLSMSRCPGRMIKRLARTQPPLAPGNGPVPFSI